MILNVSLNNNNNRNITLKDVVNIVNAQSEINPENVLMGVWLNVVMVVIVTNFTSI